MAAKSLSNFFYRGLLACLSVTVFIILGRSLIDPNWGKSKSVSFPEDIALPQWSQLKSTPISLEYSVYNRQEKVLGRQYTYIRNSQAPQVPLTVEIFYWSSPSGQMEDFFMYYSHKKAKFTVIDMDVRQKSQSFYGLYRDRNTAYLSSCINPLGNSTVTNAQFLANRNNYDLKSSRWVGVALGLKRLRNWRCLWVNIAVSSNINDTNKSYKTLNDAWQYIDSNRNRYFADFIETD